MRRIFELFGREVRHITAEHSLLLTLLLAPILYAFLYGSIYIYKDQKSVHIAVVDEDKTALSATLLSEIISARKLDAAGLPSRAAAEEAMFRGDVQGYLIIDKGLEANIYALKQANIHLYINAAQFLPASAVMATLNEIALTVGGGARKTYFEKQGLGNAAAMQMTMPVKMDYRPLFNEGKNYGTFLIPGLLAIILQQTLLIGLCAGTATEREKNTLRKLLRRYTASEIILGKGSFYWLVFMIFGLFFITVNFSVLGAAFRGSYLNVFLLTAVFLGSIISLGLLVGSFFRSTLMAFQVMGFSSYPIFMITGYSLPSQALPAVVRGISQLLPTTPFLKAYTSIVQMGGTLRDNSGHLLHLVLLWLVFTVLLMARFAYLRRIKHYEKFRQSRFKINLP